MPQFHVEVEGFLIFKLYFSTWLRVIEHTLVIILQSFEREKARNPEIQELNENLILMNEIHVGESSNRYSVLLNKIWSLLFLEEIHMANVESHFSSSEDVQTYLA